MMPDSQPVLLEGILTRPPIFDLIFSVLSPGSLIRFGRTCRLARSAISVFSGRAFNINRHLSRFISNPIAFRSLQAKTGTLISGSNALQFLDRTFYPKSDLDLYTHPGYAQEVGNWLINNEGYSFVPSASQENPDFNSQEWSSWTPWSMTLPRTDINWEHMHVQSYRFSGLDDVYHFEKPSQTGGPALQVQVIASELTPLQCIFGFHSSTLYQNMRTVIFISQPLPACVMNFITFNAAYSLYPRATFEERRSLSIANLSESDIRCLAKYSVRGWSTLSDLWLHETGAQTTFYVDQERWVTDSFSWIVPLDMTGVEPRPCLSPISQPFSWDPIQHNSWVLIRPEPSSKMFLSYHVLRPTLFRYTYLFASLNIIESLGDFLRIQGKLEHKKTALIPGRNKESSWTWCGSYNMFTSNLRTNELAGGMQFYLNILQKFALKQLTATLWTLHDKLRHDNIELVSMWRL
jgi:hypothetical protein